MNPLTQYERLPGFKQRAVQVEADVRLAVATGKSINAGEVAKRLQVPPIVAVRWLGRLSAQLGETRCTITVTDNRGFLS